MAKVPSGYDSSNVKRNEDVINVDNTDDGSVKDSIITNKKIDKNCLFCYPLSYEIGGKRHPFSYNYDKDEKLTVGTKEAPGQVCHYISGGIVWKDANIKTNVKDSRLEIQGKNCYETIIDKKNLLLSKGVDGYFNNNVINFWMLW